MLSYLTIVQLIWLLARVSYATDLFSVLRANNATIFADMIEADHELCAFYLSPTVRTVFAPVDGVLRFKNHTSSWVLHEDDPDPIFEFYYHAAEDIWSTGTNTNKSKLQSLSKRSSDSIPFLYTTSSEKVPANLEDETNQKVVLVHDEFLGYDGVAAEDPNTSSSRKLVTGLGNKVSVLKSGIKYDGGEVSLVDGFFTVPKKLSRTLGTLNDTTAFGSLLNCSNITASLDTQKGGTFFIPSNTAISALGNWTLSTAAINNHFVNNFSAYLPRLEECGTFNSASGGVLTVTKSNDGEYYVNGAKIISTNIILENGVAYVIDKVLTPPPEQQHHNAASSTIWESIRIVGSFAFSVLLAGLLLV